MDALFEDVPGVPREEIGRAFHQAMFFAFGHEVGHAYDHLSGKAFPGSAEDIADQISTYLMWSVKIDEGSVLGGLVFNEIDESDADEDLWDEHTPDKRRLANLACWSYGANPDDSAELLLAVAKRIGNAAGMARRAERCADEWARIKQVGDQAVRRKRGAAD